MKDLINIDAGNALAVFTEPERIEPILEQIASQARAIIADVSTKKGMDTIRKNAADVAKSKAFIEKHGKALADRQKEIPKLIDASRRKAKEFLDALHDEIRKPLTDYENTEKERVELLQARLAGLRKLVEFEFQPDLNMINASLMAAQATGIDATWQEYESEAAEVKTSIVSKLESLFEERKEFERLKREEAKRLEQEREEAEKRRLAEQEARLEREKQEAVERARQEILAQAEREKQAALQAQAEAGRKRQEAEEIERQKVFAEQRAALAKEREEILRKAAEESRMKIEQAKESAASAIGISRQQIHELRLSPSEEKQHKAKVHRQVVNDLKQFASIGEDEAIRVLKAVVRGQIHSIGITYDA